MVEARFWGNLEEDTGPDPQMTVNGTIDDYYSIDAIWPFNDLDTWQKHHRSYPPKKGFAEIWFRIPILKDSLHDGNYTVHAEAVTKDGGRIFCISRESQFPS